MQPYELIRSGRRTLALEVRGGRVIVRAPYRTPRATIDRFVHRLLSLYQDLPTALLPYLFSDSCRTRLVPARHGDSSGVRGAAWLPALNGGVAP